MKKLKKIIKFFIKCIKFGFILSSFVFFFSGYEKKLNMKSELNWKVNPSMPRADFMTIIRFYLSNKVVEFKGIYALKKAAYDPAISVLNIKVENAITSDAFMNDLLKSIDLFKKNGKVVNVFFHNVSTIQDFAVLSACNGRYLVEDGMILFQNYSKLAPFFKKQLEKDGVKPIVFRYGKFKSYMMHYLKEGFDYYAANNNIKFNEDKNLQFKKLVKNSSNIDEVLLEKILQNPYFLLKDAKKLNLITNTISLNVYERLFDPNPLYPQLINIKDYIAKIDSKKKFSKKKVLVIPILMPMDDFESWKSYFTAHEAAAMQADCIVLWIECPGGAVTIADYAENWVKEQQSKGKFVIAYIEDTAASGGMSLSSVCDVVISHQSSVVGSIGAFIPIIDKSKKDEKDGINYDSISHYSEFFGTSLTNKQKYFLSKMIANTSFPNKMKKRRNINVKGFDQGQIFTGKMGKALNLVDYDQGAQDLYEELDSFFNYEEYQLEFIF